MKDAVKDLLAFTARRLLDTVPEEQSDLADEMTALLVKYSKAAGLPNALKNQARSIAASEIIDAVGKLRNAGTMLDLLDDCGMDLDKDFASVLVEKAHEALAHVLRTREADDDLRATPPESATVEQPARKRTPKPKAKQDRVTDDQVPPFGTKVDDPAA